MLTTIKNRRDFLAAHGTNKKCVTRGFILLAVERGKDHPVRDTPRIGFTVTKKMGNAVVRNRIKRRLREAVRLMPSGMMNADFDYILISKQVALSYDFSSLKRDMEFAFSRIHANKSA